MIKINDITFSNDSPLVIIGGVNVIESFETCQIVLEKFLQVCSKYNMPFVFKGSFDKANRSSINSYRGVGLQKGMQIFEEIKKQYKIPLITDIHEPYQAHEVAKYVDILQLPAFLARQTDLIKAMAKTNAIINVKKPQFMGPDQVKNIKSKFVECGNHKIMFCERGSQFGYDNLIVDMLGFKVMKDVTDNSPIVFDVTHSLQRRETGALFSSGRRSQVLDLAKAGVCQRISALFIEAYPDPDKALCDGPSALPLDKLDDFLLQIKQLDDLIKSQKQLEIR